MVRKAQSAAAAAEDGNTPLFYKRPVPLSYERHAKAGLVVSQDLSFATASNSILINCVEFVEAARNYPIVFTSGNIPLPTVVLGLENENYFIGKKGAWQPDTYIPAYIRKYPFVFMHLQQDKQLVLCVDEAAPQYREKAGKDVLPFYKETDMSELTRNALEFCTAFHNHHMMTTRFCEELQKLDILTPSQSEVKLSSGRKITLGGFKIIDEAKLNALPDATIIDLHKKGWLPLIYFSLMSAAQWKRLVDIAGSREK